MSELHPHIQHLLNCISLEVEEQEKRFQLADNTNLKQLRTEGLALHPISIVRKSFGYADYPEVAFKLPYTTDTTQFRENAAIECFIEGEESVKGVFLGMDGSTGSFRMFAPDFPDWIEDKGVGIKLAPDHYTNESMSKALRSLPEKMLEYSLFTAIHGGSSFGSHVELKGSIQFKNSNLNQSQQDAVKGMLNNESLLVLHGPPGTGKTTTLVEGILQLVKNGKRIIVCAPSNAAVDNIAKKLVENELNILRVGNSTKVDDAIFPFTTEGKMQESSEQKQIKKLKIRAEEFRRMANQYKRNFGREEREQRKLLVSEVRAIRQEIKKLRAYSEEKLLEKAEVVFGTPIGLLNDLDAKTKFDVLVMDEAGQCLEPLAWVVFPYAQSWILAGDPFQLPPTVLSEVAQREGFNRSILEAAFANCANRYFLNTQYRMRASIANYSSQYFYDGALQTPSHLADESNHILFYDTAGTGYDEQSGNDGTSLINQGELDSVNVIIEQQNLNPKKVAFISPYAGQVQLAKEQLPKEIRISTIDSFQGQEGDTIIISLVRSNPDAIIGFLKDYRRMNVALTRAKEQLIIIGDSSTIGQDTFYAGFLTYLEEIGAYRSAWELMG